MKMMKIRIGIGALGTLTKGLVKGLGELEMWRHVEISQNTGKCPGVLRRLAVTQTSMKDHQLMPV